MATDMLNAYKYGWKTSYYQNTYDFKGEEEDHQPAGLSATVEDTEGEDVELELQNGDQAAVNGSGKINSNTEEDGECEACTI
jgi:ribonucleoside-diphosphate reductase alpha chain